MGTRDIKLHYKREWQALTDIDVWRYRYSSLVKDIMKRFLPKCAEVPKFTILCELNGLYVPIVDNESLSRCLLFGNQEMDMYVDVENECAGGSSDKNVREAVGSNEERVIFNQQFGYFVEEVEEEDETEVIILDSDTEDDKGDEEGLRERMEESSGESLEEDETEAMRSAHLSDSECEFSVDSADEDFRDEDDSNSDSVTSLEEEETEENWNEDRDSVVNSDEEGVQHTMDDRDLQEQLDKLERANAGIWYKPGENGIIKLHAGLLFKDVYHFRETLREYVIQEGFELIRHKNEKRRITVSCKADGCTWRLHASPTPDGQTYKIKTCIEEHNCLRQSKFKDATSAWIATKLHDKFAAEPNKSRAGIEQDLIDSFGIYGLTPMKLYRARQKAKKLIHGDHIEQYAKLRGYGELVLERNPQSIFKISTITRHSIDAPIMFKRMFVVFDGVRKAFLEGCRPFFGVDGCFLKGQYGGMFLSAIALDGNNGILSLAACIAEAENRDSWLYFFGLLREAIGDDFEGIPWTIISDRQKGLVDAVQSIFPNAIQRYCMFFIEANFKLKFRGRELTNHIWAASKACDRRGYEEAMKQLKSESIEAYDWMEKIPSHLWSRHAMNNVAKVDHICNNVSESFNNWIIKCRDKPILTLIEEYRLKVMKRLNARYKIATKWKGKLVPNVVKKLNEEWQQARKFEIFPAGQSEYQCKVGQRMYVVDLNKWICDCGRWTVTGLPCTHAVACIRTNNEEVEDYCHSSFSVATYFKVYNNIIHPQPDIGILPVPTQDKIHPPPLRRLPGRPRKA